MANDVALTKRQLAAQLASEGGDDDDDDGAAKGTEQDREGQSAARR